MIRLEKMKIELPLETWTDVFGFLSRSQLVAFSPHIRDRQFASFVQFFLHKCGQITLVNLHITTSKNGNGPIVVSEAFFLPKRKIQIHMNFQPSFVSFNLDSPVLEFMQELLRNSLLENVNLIFADRMKDLRRAFLTTILPLIASIDSIKLSNLVLYQYINKSGYSQLAKRMLKSTRVIETWWDCLSNDWYCEWLYSPREDGKPRLLVLYMFGSYASTFIELIKKGFLSSKSPNRPSASSFAFTLVHQFFNWNCKMKKPARNWRSNELIELKC